VGEQALEVGFDDLRCVAGEAISISVPVKVRYIWSQTGIQDATPKQD
jgi:hypothetical protein